VANQNKTKNVFKKKQLQNIFKRFSRTMACHHVTGPC